MNDRIDRRVLSQEQGQDIVLARLAPDELPFNYLTRVVRLSPLVTRAAATKYLFGTREIELGKPLHSGFGLFAQRLAQIDGRSSTDILHGHSLLPLFRPLADPKSYAIAQKAALSSSGTGLHLPLRTQNSHFRLTPAVCLECIRADYQQHHFAYYHRMHLPKAVQLCPIHGASLLEVCPHCGKSFSHQQLPSPLCLNCGKPLSEAGQNSDQDPHREAKLRLSRLLAGILSGQFVLPELALHLAVLRHRTDVAIRRRSGVVGDNLATHLNRTFGRTFLSDVGFRTDLAPTLGWPLLLIHGRTLKHNPIANGLIVASLFESMADYMASVVQTRHTTNWSEDAAQVLTGAGNINTAMLKDGLRGVPYSRVAKHHKTSEGYLGAWINGYVGLRERRDANISRRSSGSDGKGPSPQRRVLASLELQATKSMPSAADDEAISREFRRKIRIVVQAAGRPIRINPEILLKLTGLATLLPADRKEFPTTLAAIADVTEDEEQYYRRAIEWAAGDLTHKNGACDHLTELMVHAHIPLKYVRSLEAFAGTHLRPRQAPVRHLHTA